MARTHASLVTKHLTKSLATSKGHLHMQQKNMQSTKMTADVPLATSLDFSPSQEPQNNCTYATFTTILPATKLEKLNHDQTGKFLV
jgi:outer membrane receptor for monomeric catechols